MTSSDRVTASHATHSARRWARALYLAAFDEQPVDVTTSARAPRARGLRAADAGKLWGRHTRRRP